MSAERRHHTEKDAAQDEAAARDRNLRYLDAVCRWAEALVDLRTAELYGDQSDDVLAALSTEMESAEEMIREVAGEAAEAGRPVPFALLRGTYGLTPHEEQVVRIALAPSLDPSFRKRVARYKDNVLLDYVDIDFVLAMLFESRVERMRARDLFLPGARLVRDRLVSLALPRDATADTVPAHEVRVPERLVTFLLGHDHLEKQVAAFCELSRPDADPAGVVMDEKVKAEVGRLLRGWQGRDPESRRGLAIGLFGPPGTGKSLFASAIASQVGAQLITADSAKISFDDMQFRDAVEAIFFDAKVRGAVLAFDHCEVLLGQKNPRIPPLLAHIDRHPGLVLLLSSDPRQIDTVIERHVGYQVEFEAPDTAQREALWRLHLAGGGLPAAEGADLPGIASTFDFTGGQIRNAVAVARELASERGAAELVDDDLTAGAWAQVRADMEEYSKKRKVRLTLDDLILPDEEMKQVREVLEAAQNRTYIMTRWGFGKRLTTGKGLCCLFTGDPGTGKTLCAEILSEALGQNLYQINIPRVMSKYIGETEKNIERIFSTAKANNSMLLFDEADALFTTRVKVETSVDRFSNMEINLMLQEIERFDGIVILTTNLEKNLDKAFERRVQFKIRFPFPDKRHRSLIWRTLIPKECPVDTDIDWDLVGESFELSGGNIKNAILRAAYKAARDAQEAHSARAREGTDGGARARGHGGAQRPFRGITMDHVVAAAEAECRHAGKLFRGLKRDDD
ncbi:MAG: ATP-binding protein [Deltaproteobacteria bacterium]|nr:ATP-binding protein [Deltaproteobacteria bacterium]